MTISLPTNSLRGWPVFAVFYKNENSKKWMPIKTMGNDEFNMIYSAVAKPQAGIYVADIAIRSLPNYSTATLQTPIGNINRQNINFKNNEITAHDLSNTEIYITQSLNGEAPRVVFWGVVDYQKDDFSPASNPHIIGTRTYQCVDLLYYHTYRATLDFHGFEHEGVKYNRSPGMPVYNGRKGRDDILQGNKSKHSLDKFEPILSKSGSEVDVQRFTFDGLGSEWSDTDVLQHAIHNGQRHGHMVEFNVVDKPQALTNRKNVWRVREGERAWNLIKRITDFRRGTGVAAFTFTSSNGVPSNPTLTIFPITDSDMKIVSPIDGSETHINGASNASVNSSTTVDLTGDHRNVSSFFNLGGLEDFRYDRIEVTGDKIQVLCQLSYGEETLIKLWSDEEESDFDSLSDADANKYDHVYRLFGFPRNWQGHVGNGNGTSPVGQSGEQIYYFCNDAGEIQQARNNGYLDAHVNPALIRILPDLPLHNGIDPITGERYSGSGSALGPSMRGRMLIHRRTGDDSYELLQVQQRIKLDGIWIGSRGDSNIERALQDDYEDLVVTCCLEIPYRVSIARGVSYDKAVKTKRIRIPGLHLWIGPKNAMYSIPESDSVTRFAETTILRDDREKLAIYAHMIEQWYRQPHQSAKWALKDFGIDGSFEQVGDDNAITTTDYPKLGELVTTITAAGSEHPINAPVTQVIYDNKAGITYWQCDWGELEI